MKRFSNTVVPCLLVLVLVVAGCDVRRVGGRCTASKSGPARDATHVLVCSSNDRWVRAIRLTDVPKVLAGLQPGAITTVTDNVKVGTGGSLRRDLHPSVVPGVLVDVTRRAGGPAGGVTVVIEAPTSGPSLSSNSELRAVTNRDGRAQFLYLTANGELGDYVLTARVEGTDVTSTIRVTNEIGAASKITLTGGGAQTIAAGATSQPITFHFEDGFGHPTPGREVRVMTNPFINPPPDPVTFSPSPATTDANGNVSVTATSTTPGTYTVWAFAGPYQGSTTLTVT